MASIEIGQILFMAKKTAEKRADELEIYCHRHLKNKGEISELYRIFYYDCRPINKKVFHPYLKTHIDLGTTSSYAWATKFISELKHKRKFA